MNQDTTTTLAGGALGVHLLMNVNYAALPAVGEFTKLGVAFGLMVLGYLMYRKNPTPSTEQSTVAILDAKTTAPGA